MSLPLKLLGCRGCCISQQHRIVQLQTPFGGQAYYLTAGARYGLDGCIRLLFKVYEGLG